MHRFIKLVLQAHRNVYRSYSAKEKAYQLPELSNSQALDNSLQTISNMKKMFAPSIQREFANSVSTVVNNGLYL